MIPIGDGNLIQSEGRLANVRIETDMIPIGDGNSMSPLRTMARVVIETDMIPIGDGNYFAGMWMGIFSMGLRQT